MEVNANTVQAQANEMYEASASCSCQCPMHPPTWTIHCPAIMIKATPVQ